MPSCIVALVLSKRHEKIGKDDVPVQNRRHSLVFDLTLQERVLSNSLMGDLEKAERKSLNTEDNVRLSVLLGLSVVLVELPVRPPNI